MVETLYATPGQYWSLPQDGSLTNVWAIAGDRACTIGASVRCAPVRVTEEPKLSSSVRPVDHPEETQGLLNLPFAKDCVTCGVRRFPLDPGQNWEGKVVMAFRVDPDGSVSDYSEDGAPEGPIGALIEEQFKHWKFAAPGADAAKSTDLRHLTIDVKCADEPRFPPWTVAC